MTNPQLGFDELAAAPAAPGDEWAFNSVIMTDSGPVLTAGRDVIYPDVDTPNG